MKKQQATTTVDESLLAIAERHSDLWRVLLVRRGERPVALQTREFGRADESASATSSVLEAIAQSQKRPRVK